MSNEQTELFAFMKSLHSVHVYFLLISPCQSNGMRLDAKIYLLLTDFFFRLMFTLCSQMLH